MAKRVLLPTNLITFDPTSQTINFKEVPNFDCRKVMAIIDTTYEQTLIYSVASYAQGLGGAWTDPDGLGYPYFLNLLYNTNTGYFFYNDLLQIIYEDANQGIHDANGLPIYSSPDNMSERNGLDVNLLNGSVIGQVGQQLDDPYADSAVSVAFNQGGTLISPAMDPVSGELITRINSSGNNFVNVRLSNEQLPIPSAVYNASTGSNADFGTGTFTSNTLRVVVAEDNPYMNVRGPVYLQTAYTLDVATSFSGASTSVTTGVSVSNISSSVFYVDVNSVSGTNPTFDLTIEESYDNGSTYNTIYSFPRITATGKYQTPLLNISGTHIRYRRTSGGTSPVFTVFIHRDAKTTNNGQNLRVFIDRTINLNTLNSTTPSYFIQGCNNIEMTISTGAGGTGTNPVVAVEMSDDNTNWLTSSANISSIAASTNYVVNLNGYQPRFIRAKVTTAGTSGYTINFVSLKGLSN